MQALILYASFFIAYVHAICTGSKYWNPLNNACVNCNPIITQSAPGNRPTITTPTPPPTNACSPVPPHPVSMPTTIHKNVCRVHIVLCSLSMESYQNILWQLLPKMCHEYVLINLDCPSSPPTYAYDASTSGTCVRYCPSGTYSLDSNRTCVTTCPVYYYINYTLNIVQYQCVASCP